MAPKYSFGLYGRRDVDSVERAIIKASDYVFGIRNLSRLTGSWKEHKAPSLTSLRDYYEEPSQEKLDTITGIITEEGIAYPPYEESLKEMVRRAEERRKNKQL